MHMTNDTTNPKKPLIGVFTKNIVDRTDEKNEIVYVASIEQSGGIPLVLPYDKNDKVLDHYVSVCDGFFFTGGVDIDPSRYGALKHAKCGETDIRRDEFEFAAIKKILKTNKPILGICRGMQIINVALGGTLYQDIPSEVKTSTLHRQRAPKFSPSHGVNVTKGTPLYFLANKTRMIANSFHHQCIKVLGEGLSVMATADDGIIEAVCFVGERYIRAYQWHPERLYVTDSLNRRLFCDFIEACRILK